MQSEHLAQAFLYTFISFLSQTYLNTDYNINAIRMPCKSLQNSIKYQPYKPNPQKLQAVNFYIFSLSLFSIYLAYNISAIICCPTCPADPLIYCPKSLE